MLVGALLSISFLIVSSRYRKDLFVDSLDEPNLFVTALRKVSLALSA